MQKSVLQVGNRVYVISYSPFRGLRGVIQCVDEIPLTPDLSEPFCFYLVRLEGAQIKDPIWFHYEEVEPITSTR